MSRAASISEPRQLVGSRVPLGGPFLPQTHVDAIGAWIAQGAPNN